MARGRCGAEGCRGWRMKLAGGEAGDEISHPSVVGLSLLQSSLEISTQAFRGLSRREELRSSTLAAKAPLCRSRKFGIIGGMVQLRGGNTVARRVGMDVGARSRSSCSSSMDLMSQVVV